MRDQQFRVFERKVMKRIYGLIKNKYRKITYEEIDLLIKHVDVVRYIKAQRIRWIGHIVRMGKERRVKRIAEWRPNIVRRIGRPRLRWEDNVREVLGKTEAENRSKMAMDRETWKGTVEQAKTHN